MATTLLIERAGGVVTLTLNQPFRANVIDVELGEALIDAVASLAADPSLRAVLLQATGRHFCAGGDIEAFWKAGSDLPGLLERGIPPLHDAILTLAMLPVPVVSALNGPVGGGGIGLALCADIVIAAQSMKLRGGYSAIGLTPDFGTSWFLSRLVGPMRAKQILFTNEPLSAQECLALGLVTQVVPDHALPETARRLVASLAASATGSLARIKSLVDGASLRSLREQVDLECRYMVESGGSVDAAEGARAFVEKRAPHFGAVS